MGSDTSTERGRAQNFDLGQSVHRVAQMAHEAIDRIQQTLESSSGPSGTSNAARYEEVQQRARQYGERAKEYGQKAREYGEQARQYGQQARERIHDQPLQSAAIAFAAGWVYSKVFMRTRHKVHVVKVPVPVVPPEFGDTLRAHGERAQGWMQSTGRRLGDSGHASMHRLGESGQHAMHRLGESSQHAMHKLGASTLVGLAGAKAVSSKLWDKTRAAMPRDMDQVKAGSYRYGTMAREQMQEHPAVGLGLAIALGAVAVKLMMPSDDADSRTSSPQPRQTLVVDKDGRAFGEPSGYQRVLIGSRPVMSGALALGMGVLLGAVLTARR
ncbi:hypothetical protein EZ242_03295 [Ramlibacter rhizophilus]|uniref:DUF883 family protein n=2 Tax=Ramlibacter rhizophilus TaxID=1781167 RepID=A0A4Z0C3K0_9BURK|nr:hypothetical protein EZ242_03295 [Ramlibacter rhizophilus]